MFRRVALLRSNISEDFRASILRVTRMVELGTTLALTSNRRIVARSVFWTVLQQPNTTPFGGTPRGFFRTRGYSLQGASQRSPDNVPALGVVSPKENERVSFPAEASLFNFFFFLLGGLVRLHCAICRLLFG
jgi:hypothetical protein